jgi:biuret amidohydrolase
MKGILENSVAAPVKLEGARTAVIGIHWQNDVLDPKGAFGPIFAGAVADSGVVGRTQKLFAAARAAGALIVYANVAYWPGHVGHVRNNAVFNTAAERNAFVRGSSGIGIAAAMAPSPGDVIIEHSRISAFYGSDLLSVLIGHDINTLVLTGIATNVAVDHTARDAAQYGFRTLLAEDCCFSSDPAHHEASLMSLRALTSGIFKAQDLIGLLA